MYWTVLEPGPGSNSLVEDGSQFVLVLITIQV